MKILFASDLSFYTFSDYLGDKVAEDTMENTAKYFKKADFSVINLEDIFGDKDKYKPINKSGPNLISNEKFIKYLEVLNPTAVGMANNHTKDYGEKPLLNTIKMLKERNYKTFGAGKNIEEAYKPVTFIKDDLKVSVIGICENEFGIAGEECPGTAGYNLKRAYKEINKALENKEIPLIFFHGGNEENPFPSPYKNELYHHFIDMGARAVIAMHTHCPQGYEYYKDCPIVYSMGNFFFPEERNKKSWDYGYMTELDIEESNIKINIIPYKFTYTSHDILEGEEKEEFLRYMEELKKPLSSEKKLKELFDSWCMITGINDYINWLKYEENMDTLHLCALKNLFSCEAHNELIKNTLNIIYEGKTKEAKKYIPYIKKMQNMEIN